MTAVGILGGTFDPIHHGHLSLARAVRDALGLDRILVIPNARPPHKEGRSITPAAHRLAMVRLAVAEEPGFEISTIELDRPGPSYTVDTVESLAATERAAGREPDLVVILSSESFADLPTSWHEPERLLRAARIAVAPRPGVPAPTRAWLERELGPLADRVVVVDAPAVPVSASVVRRRAADGQAIDQLVPAVVAAYIEEHHLYRQPTPEDPLPVTDPATIDPRPDRPTDDGPDGPSGAADRGTADRGADTGSAPTAATAVAPRPDGLPQRDAVEPTDERPPLDIARRIVELAEDKKAADIVLLDLTGLTTLADAFVICSGGSERQLDAIAEGVIDGMRTEKVRPIGREGTAASHWVLVDFGAVVVHIFTPPEREYYSLEKHWSEAKTILRVQ